MLKQELKNKFLTQLVKNNKLNTEQKEILTDVNSFTELEQRLSHTGWIEVEALAKAKADLLNLPYQDLLGTKVKAETLNLIPRELAQNYQAIGFAQTDHTVKVGLVEPNDLKTQEALQFLAREKNLKINFFAISKASFDAAIKQYSALKTEVAEALGVAKKKLKQADALETIEDVVSSAPISKMVAVILKHAVEERASDIHIEPVMNQTRVRYRVDGIMHTSLLLPRYVHAAVISRIKVMANLKIDETRIPQDGRIRLKIANKDIDFRISTLPLYRSEKIVMRILDTESGALKLAQLGFDDRNLEIIKDNINKPHGMFLVTGPTGSGKSTTLYAVLSIINKESINIITLEDPVEYYIEGVNQSQINPDVGLTFASGLRSILRQDPDVIMVGEIRDQETAGLAVHAALTGHIVLSTLHTNDAFGSVPRLLDLKVEGFLLASTLNVVIAQRLVRKLCPDCRQKVSLPKNVATEIAAEFKNINQKYLPKDIKVASEYEGYEAKGCSHCGRTGYRGRLAISEVLPINNEVKNLIRGQADWNKIEKLFFNLGMVTIKQDGFFKVLRGQTSLEEVLRATKE